MEGAHHHIFTSSLHHFITSPSAYFAAVST